MWNGTFAMKKSIGSVKFVPLFEMTVRDWLWLEYDNIRTIAQNRIAEIAANGQLVGFFQVKLDKARAKREYFWPVNPAMYDEFMEADEVSEDGFLDTPAGGSGEGPAKFFTNYSEQPAATTAVSDLDRLGRRFDNLPESRQTALLLLLFKALPEDEGDKNAVWQSNAEAVWNEYQNTDDALLIFPIIALLMFKYSMDEIAKSITYLVESEDFDETSERIEELANELYAEIVDGRNSKAAAK